MAARCVVNDAIPKRKHLHNNVDNCGLCSIKGTRLKHLMNTSSLPGEVRMLLLFRHTSKSSIAQVELWLLHLNNEFHVH